jgi:hypothetical protein
MAPTAQRNRAGGSFPKPLCALRSSMQDFRIAVGNSLKDKLGELGFFLQQIVDVARDIERKPLYQEYPINAELAQLNYYFSAYLNAIQALRKGEGRCLLFFYCLILSN